MFRLGSLLVNISISLVITILALGPMAGCGDGVDAVSEAKPSSTRTPANSNDSATKCQVVAGEVAASEKATGCGSRFSNFMTV